MGKYTKEDIKRLIEEKRKLYSFTIYRYSGTIKNVEIPVSQLDKALENKMMFDGSSIEGFFESKNLICIYILILILS